MIPEYTQLKNSRFERKFVCNLSNHRIELEVKKNPELFHEIFNERYINNIYLDTNKLTYYYDNIIGNSDRKKARIRWYGDLFGKVNSPVLEFKIKSGVVGHKISFPLKSFVLNKDFSIENLTEIFENSDLPTWAVFDLKKLQPTLVNRYKRKYFRTFDKKYRITLDSELNYRNISNRFNTFQSVVKDNNSIILELKYDLPEDKNADNISNYFPFRMSKSSKYVNGIEKTHFNIAI